MGLDASRASSVHPNVVFFKVRQKNAGFVNIYREELKCRHVYLYVRAHFAYTRMYTSLCIHVHEICVNNFKAMVFTFNTNFIDGEQDDFSEGGTRPATSEYRHSIVGNVSCISFALLSYWAGLGNRTC